MRKLFTLILTLCVFSPLFSQYLEVGTTVGLSSSISDLQPASPNLGSFGATYGLLGRFHYRPKLSFKATALKGLFYATDRYAKGSIRLRNLECQTQYYELAATAEWHLLPYDIMEGKTNAPYLFAGIAGLYFNTQARPDITKDEWVNLRSLGTEGQNLNGGKPYSQIQLAIPFGMGIKMAIGKRINIGFEAGLRYTFTDYLDDISGNYPDLDALATQDPLAAAMSFRMPEVVSTQIELPSGQKRGDNYKNDWYYYIGSTLTFNLADKKKLEFNPQYKAF